MRSQSSLNQFTNRRKTPHQSASTFHLWDLPRSALSSSMYRWKFPRISWSLRIHIWLPPQRPGRVPSIARRVGFENYQRALHLFQLLHSAVTVPLSHSQETCEKETHRRKPANASAAEHRRMPGRTMVSLTPARPGLFAKPSAPTHFLEPHFPSDQQSRSPLASDA